MRAVALSSVLVSVATLLAACYGPSINPCHVTCESSAQCPSGSTCGADNRCQPSSGPACGSDGDGGTDGDPMSDANPDAPPNTGTWKALAVGRHVGCAIGMDDNLVYCWGDNSAGQLGVGNTSDRADARPVDEAGPFRLIAAGNKHACAIKENGELWCWGDAIYGQVTGTNQAQIEADPKQMVHPTSQRWTAVDGGARHTCAIDEDAELWCWGSNDVGQLGDGGSTGVRLPVKVLPTGQTVGTWKSLTADNLRTCAIWGDDTAYCWGQGALGLAVGGNPHEQASAMPAAVAGGTTWKSLAAGEDHTCGVTTANTLMCWGNEQLGEMGSGNSSATPVVARSETDFGIVFAGPLVTCATRTNPAAFLCFGDNREGQLGTGNRNTITIAMPAISGAVVAGGGGENFTCALADDGALYCWGRDDDGRCGDGQFDDRFIDVPVTGVTGPLADFSTSGDTTCVVTAANHTSNPGRMYCWGSNNEGQLGIGDRTDRPTPVEIPRPSGASWTNVATGFRHTCGLANAKLYCWGNDDDGQLGNGTAGRADTPQAIQPTRNWQSVSVGPNMSCAIDTNSARWCWGSNFQDSLGGGGSIGSFLSAPTQMMPGTGPTTWARIASGDYFSCGIGGPGANAGEVWCWGKNDQGQLGSDGTPATSNVPLHSVVTAPDQFQWLAVDSLWGAVCGIRAPDASGGKLWCWGNNDTYQFGTGNMTGFDVPTQIGDVDWLRVDIGLNFTCGIDTTLGLRCWGANSSLMVGDRDVGTITTVPGTRTWPDDVTQVWTGWEHACLLASDNTIRCWGDGAVGQLGDGNMAHLAPTRVVRGQ